MRKQKANNERVKQSWRDLTQTGKARHTRTRKARWRSIRMSMHSCMLVGGILATAYAGYLAWMVITSEDEKSMHHTVLTPQNLLKRVKFSSDGVLGRDWFLNYARNYQGKTLMELNLKEIKEALEQNGQVKEATIKRQLPDALRIHLKERTPLLRARVQLKNGVINSLLIATDGAVYEGNGYEESMLEEMPYLGGVVLKRDKIGFQPIRWIPRLALFLSQAKARIPGFYSDWYSISVEELTPGNDEGFRRIRVKSHYYGELIFDAHNLEDQFLQLIRVAKATENREGIEKIDFTQPGKVIVGYESSDMLSNGRGI